MRLILNDGEPFVAVDALLEMIRDKAAQYRHEVETGRWSDGARVELRTRAKEMEDLAHALDESVGNQLMQVDPWTGKPNAPRLRSV